MVLTSRIASALLALTITLAASASALADQTAVELIRNKQKLGPLTTKLSNRPPKEGSYGRSVRGRARVRYEPTL